MRRRCVGTFVKDSSDEESCTVRSGAVPLSENDQHCAAPPSYRRRLSARARGAAIRLGEPLGARRPGSCGRQVLCGGLADWRQLRHCARALR